MCGIAAILSHNKVPNHWIQLMTDRIRHRGPDDEGYVIIDSEARRSQICAGSDSKINAPAIDKSPFEGNILLGHRRLSIIDLSVNAHQPMSYRNRYWIIYNGEIYNYVELKKELLNEGYVFRTESDTEVILASYDRWGSRCLERFNGMWSFILVDLYERTLFISRDRFGKKPLYYYQDPKYLVFASEIKAILALPFVPREPNLKYCSQYLQFGTQEYLKETAFMNIKRFPIRCYSLVNIRQDISSTLIFHPYWDLELVERSSGKYSHKKAKQYAEEYRCLLKSAISLRLRSDVPVGSALSGGLDSASVVVLIKEILEEKNADLSKQETFSTVYKNPATKYCDESYYIDLLTNKLGLKSHQIEPNEDEILSEHRKIIYALDTPPNGLLISSWYTYKLISCSSVKVTLDGQGADELLAGYLRYLTNYLVYLKNNLLTESKNCLKIPGARKLVLNGAVMNIYKRIFSDWGINYLENMYERSLKRLKPLNEVLIEDIKTNLVNLLHYGDRHSMAYAIETRMPFLDHNLVQFINQVPGEYKIHNGWTKYIARLAMAERLPEQIVWRKDKMGWPNPEKYWLSGPFKNFFCYSIANSKFLKSFNFNEDMCKKLDGITNFSLPVKLFNLAIWYNVFFENFDGNYFE